MTPESLKPRKPMKTPKQYRQGDVLLVPCTIPHDATPLSRDDTRVVVAYGEATGHCHALTGEATEKLFLDGIEYLRLTVNDMLTHEEHEAIEVDARPAPLGYRIVHQREFHLQEIKRVID